MGGNNLLVAGNMNHIRLYDMEKLGKPAQVDVPGGVARAAFVSGDSVVVAPKGEAKLRVFDLRSMTQSQEFALEAPAVDLEVTGGMLTVAMPTAVSLYDLSGAAPKHRSGFS